MTTVSFVVTSYNHASFVGVAVRSILEQSHQDFEICIVDDGSTDESRSILRGIGRQDSRVKVVEQENRGVVEARNRGFEMTTGEFVSFLDSDDWYPPDRTERMLASIEPDPSASLIYGDAWLAGSDGNTTGRFWDLYPPVDGPFSARLWAYYCFVPSVSVMFRRESFKASGKLWGPGPSCDYLKWIELGLRGGAIRLSGRPLGSWRLHGANVSQQRADQISSIYLELRQALMSLLDRNPELSTRLSDRAIMRRLSRCHVSAAFRCAHSGHWRLARKHASLAVADRLDVVTIGMSLVTLPLLRNVFRPALRRRAKRFRLPE